MIKNQSGRLSVLGTALLAFGLARVIKMLRLERNPDKAADYEATYAEIAAGLIAALTFNSEIICQVLCCAACFTCLLYFGLFVCINRLC